MALNAYALEKVHFLAIDDIRHSRVLTREMLCALRVKHVCEATDGADGFKEMRASPFDIVIVDWEMEPLNGIEFVRLVRTASDSPNPYVPIILLTCHTEAHRVAEARNAGVTEFLAKPASPRDLYARVVEFIESPRPFVKTETFCGPCRRRKWVVDYTGPLRRTDDDQGEMSHSDVRELLRPRQLTA